MKGRGVIAHTRKLTDALWNAVPGAIIGSSAVVLGATLGPLMWLLSLNGWPTWITVSVAACSLGCILLGIPVARPWFKAERELREHREAMESETAKRGSGWAES